jgi:hypothetical protein
MTGGSARTVVKEETGEDSVGAKMMKLMGWTEGAAIGDRFKVNIFKLGRAAKRRFPTLSRSVPDPNPDPDPPDPHVFGPPGTGSGSISQRYGSGSFYQQAKIV